MGKLIVFNWKMNPSSFKEAEKIFSFCLNQIQKLPPCFSLAIAPPFIYLERFSYLINSSNKEKRILLTAQNVSFEDYGNFTGEISALMLRDVGVSYAIVGHSERRSLFKESDSLIAQKIKILLDNKITPILCIGEKEKTSFSLALSWVKRQIKKDLVFYREKKNLIIAYEPVWSIGGNKPVDFRRAALMIEKIKFFLKEKFNFSFKVIYGGSIDCQKIENFLKYSQIDGFLVGSASLSLKEIKCLLKKISENC